MSCRYCGHTNQPCLAESPVEHIGNVPTVCMCGRTRNHEGPHVACLYNGRHKHKTWPRRSKQKRSAP